MNGQYVAGTYSMKPSNGISVQLLRNLRASFTFATTPHAPLRAAMVNMRAACSLARNLLLW